MWAIVIDSAGAAIRFHEGQLAGLRNSLAESNDVACSIK
jgi:hypothetical protein